MPKVYMSLCDEYLWIIFEIQDPPAMIQTGGSQLECITGVLNRSDRLLLVLDVGRMFTENEPDAMAAAA